MAADVASIVRVGLVIAILQTLDASEIVAVFAEAGLAAPKAIGAKANESVARKIPDFEIFEVDADGFTASPADKKMNVYIDISAQQCKE
jgi:hypothetical protein